MLNSRIAANAIYIYLKKGVIHLSNIFCRVEFLNGSTRIYQFPNDLKDAMFTEGVSNVRKMLKGSLINVPTSNYSHSGKAAISVARIKQVFAMKKTYSPHSRTRGQFINAKDLNVSPSINFLLHDYSFLNKLRIRLQCLRWKRRLAKRSKA